MPTLECNYVENRIFSACTKSMGTRNRHMIMINKLVRRKGKGVKIGEKRKEKKVRGTRRNKE